MNKEIQTMPASSDVQVKMMIGSTGNEDYLVVTETKEYVIGLKPVFEITDGFLGMALLMVGYRIRVIPKKGDLVKDKLVASYPDIAFDKISEKRASLWIGKAGPLPKLTTYSNFMGGDSHKIISTLVDNACKILRKIEKIKFSKEFLEQLFTETYTKNLNELSNLMDKAEKEKEGSIYEGKTVDASTPLTSKDKKLLH